MIGLVGPRGDRHLAAVHKELVRRGARSFWLDAARFPSVANVTWTLDGATWDGVSLSELTAVWFRRFGTRVDVKLDQATHAFARSQVECGLWGIARSLPSARWYNKPMAFVDQDGGFGKFKQLEVARKVGLTVPRTCFTNDPSEAKKFVASVDKAICKPLRSVRGREVYTNRVNGDENFDLLRRAPFIFQEEIPKRFEVRALLADNRLMATEIHSPNVDFRVDLRVKHVPHEMDDAVAAKLLQLHQALGLRMSIHDLIVTPDGDYVYLESNQQGEFLWLQEKTGQDYVGVMADVLVGRS